ncbi:MAG: hypothetical protein K8R02_06375 [Anaerohalosphaeraceae bacterium]|nr:hypothetical protein [Anaerohalosphaeraceae bacterium]
MSKLFTRIVSRIRFLVLLAIFSLQCGCQAGMDTGFFIQDGLLEGVEIEAAKLGDTMPISEFGKRAKDYPYLVIVGKIDNINIVSLLKEQKVIVDSNWLGEQGFQIHSWKNKKNIITLVTGAEDVGVLYGLLDLPLQTEYLGFDTVKNYLSTEPKRRDKPFFQLRRGLLNDRANFNLSYLRNIILYGYDKWPEVFEDKDQKRKIIEMRSARTEEFERLYKQSEKYGAKLFLWVYEPTFSVHSERFYKAHPEADARDNKGYLNPNAEIVKTIIREKYRDIWRRYPKLGGVYLSFKNGGRSYLTPSLASKATHKPYDSAAEYVSIIESAMREYNPDACVIVRAWKLHKSKLELLKLSKVLPPSVRYGCKSTCPPGNDYLWHDILTPYLEKIPNLFLNGQTAYNTDGPVGVASHLCYEGPKLEIRALKMAKLTNYGAWYGDKTLEDYIDYGKLRYAINTPSRRSVVYIGWNPYNFDPNTHIAGFGKHTFGEQAGKHFSAAMKDIWKVTDAMVFRPEWTDGKAWTNHLHIYHFFPWKRTGYSTGVQQPRKFTTITADDLEFEKFRKRLDIIDAVTLAEYAVTELEKAAQSQPKNPDLLQTYLKAAKATAHLTRAWRSYHLGLLYHSVVKNTSKLQEAAKFQKMSADYMTTALSEMWKYRDGFFEIYPDIRSHAKYRGKHPKLYLSTVTQEIQDGYHNVILAPKLEKFKLLWQLSSHKETVPQYSVSAGQASAPPKTIAVTDVPDGGLVPLISPNVLPELNLTFEADLTAGGIVKIAERTWLGRSKRDTRIKHKGYYFHFGIADIEVLLDGKRVGYLTEYGELYTEKLADSWIRYIELPPTSKGKHTLTLRSLGMTGMELQRITLYAGGESLPIKIPEAVRDDFSHNPQWQTQRSGDSRMKMYYDQQDQSLRFDIWREKGDYTTFSRQFPEVWPAPVSCEFDLKIEEAPHKSWSTIGLLPLAGKSSLAVRLYAESATQVRLSPSDIKLRLGRWYRIKLQKKTIDQITIIVADTGGGANTVFPAEKYQQWVKPVSKLKFNSFGVTNSASSSKVIGPMKITIDNLHINFF